MSFAKTKKEPCITLMIWMIEKVLNFRESHEPTRLGEITLIMFSMNVILILLHL